MHGEDALHYYVIHCTFIIFFIMVLQKKLYIFIADHTVIKCNKEMFKKYSGEDQSLVRPHLVLLTPPVLSHFSWLSGLNVGSVET